MFCSFSSLLHLIKWVLGQSSALGGLFELVHWSGSPTLQRQGNDLTFMKTDYSTYHSTKWSSSIIFEKRLIFVVSQAILPLPKIPDHIEFPFVVVCGSYWVKDIYGEKKGKCWSGMMNDRLGGHFRGIFLEIFNTWRLV